MRQMIGVVLALLVPAGLAAGEVRGIQPADIDRATEPCTDFYQFANGTWRTNNPIPASMPRWSKRWAAGESSKDKLKDILEDAAKVMAEKFVSLGKPE